MSRVERNFNKKQQREAICILGSEWLHIVESMPGYVSKRAGIQGVDGNGF